MSLWWTCWIMVTTWTRNCPFGSAAWLAISKTSPKELKTIIRMGQRSRIVWLLQLLRLFPDMPIFYAGSALSGVDRTEKVAAAASWIVGWSIRELLPEAWGLGVGGRPFHKILSSSKVMEQSVDKCAQM